MSNLIVPDGSENTLNALWLSAAGSGIVLSLYQNNYTPVPGSVFSSFTKATFTGYADVAQTFGSPVTVSGKSTITATSASQFIMGTPGTGNTIYGYYVWITGANLLLWAEEFDNPIVLANAGDEIDVTAVFTLFSEF